LQLVNHRLVLNLPVIHKQHHVVNVPLPQYWGEGTLA
jgi:hypothetical protein